MAQMTLCARSAGYLFPVWATQVYRVHSVFTHAVNLSSEAGSFVTLLCAQRYPNLPDAVRVALPEGWDWRRKIAPSEYVLLSHGRLQTHRFSVEMNGASVWQTDLKGGSLTPSAFPQVLQHYPTIASQLLLFCLKHNVESALLWPGSVTHQGLQPHEHPEMLERQIHQLIGYGKGLTPDGDDYLLGYLAALWPWQLPAQLARHQRTLHEGIKRYLPNTTDISRHYLGRALQGHFSQPVCHLLEQLARSASPATIVNCTERVMKFGATSGVDCLAGLLHGIRTLNATA